ncbi:MAG: hypothetical protein WCR46_12660 [Deltaproteobacteria bacterium]
MKRFIGAVTVVVACLVMAGGAFAFNYTDHVSVAPNGKGDLLVFPVYMAMGGQNPIQTKITVVNTSTTHSVVAKVVVRSFAYSKELLDFLIYLSPTDMWIGTLQFVGNSPVMISTDKSGPVALAKGQPLTAVTCTGATGDKGVDSNQFGYVEVIEAWSADLGLKSPIDKVKIIDAYDASPKTGAYPYTGALTVDMLSGSYQISVPTLAGWEAADNAFAMKSYDNKLYLSPAVETVIGLNARNNIQEIEAGFNKDAVAMAFNNNPVDGGSMHLFTFPTKVSNAAACTRVATSGSVYFPVDGKVKYGKTVYDNEENSTINEFSPSPTAPDMVDEVMSLYGPIDFKVGWVLYSFTKTGTAGATLSGLPLNYTGTPVIPTILDFKDGVSIRSGVWTDGIVSSVPAGPALPGYQYSSEFVTSTK